MHRLNRMASRSGGAVIAITILMVWAAAGIAQDKAALAQK